MTELCGIAGGIGRFLADRGVTTCGDMKRLPISTVAARFGHPGRRLWLMAQGRDPEPVIEDNAPPQTIGHGKLVPPDTRSREVLALYYMHMAEKIGRRLRRNELEAQQYAISLKTQLARIGHVYKTEQATDDGHAIYRLAEQFLTHVWAGQGGFQVQITALDPRPAAQQGDLFAMDTASQDGLNAAMDAINARFGAFAVHRTPLIHRTDAPDVIAPGWRPHGHRDSIER